MLKLHFERRKEDYAGVAIALYFGEIVGVFCLFSVLDCSDLLFLRQFPIELLECDCSFYVIALFVWALLCVFFPGIRPPLELSHTHLPLPAFKHRQGLVPSIVGVAV